MTCAQKLKRFLKFRSHLSQEHDGFTNMDMILLRVLLTIEFRIQFSGCDALKVCTSCIRQAHGYSFTRYVMNRITIR
ncbi:hypothetical protein QOZ95_004051 [Paenibacillus brasilensis]|uniref:Uncharacterized protein n=1 Tax=Paenibacillus brasilensis TaxID=128574 RepID=A0ABU0L3K3_9BACL|nr:hypothetical protein [Paenibacillus brasilensis]